MLSSKPESSIEAKVHPLAPSEKGSGDTLPDERGTVEAIQVDDLEYDTPRGWACVLGVFLIAVHTWGMDSAYGVFLTYYATSPSFQPTSNVMFAYVGGLSIAVAFVVSPFVGYYVSKGYGRPLLLAGVAIETGAYVAASFATRSWHLFVTQGVAYGLGMGLLYIGSVGIISQWFRRHTGLANATAAAGTGVGGIAYSLGTNRMLETLGYATTMRVLAGLIFVFNGAAVLLLRDRNRQIGVVARSPFDLALLLTPGYPLILLYGLCCLFGYIMGLFSLSSYCTSIGLTAHQGSVAVAMMSVGQAFGRPAVGFLCDRFGILNVTACAAALSTVLNFIMWPLAKSYGPILAFGVLAGTVTGTFYAVVAPLTAKVVGIRELTRALSLIWIILAIPATFSQVVANSLIQVGGGSYLPVQMFSGSCYALALACMAIFRATLLQTANGNQSGFMTRLFTIDKI